MLHNSWCAVSECKWSGINVWGKNCSKNLIKRLNIHKIAKKVKYYTIARYAMARHKQSKIEKKTPLLNQQLDGAIILKSYGKISAKNRTMIGNGKIGIACILRCCYVSLSTVFLLLPRPILQVISCYFFQFLFCISIVYIKLIGL